MEIGREEIVKVRGRDGARFIDDYFNIRERTREFHSAMVSLCLGLPFRYSKMTMAAQS